MLPVLLLALSPALDMVDSANEALTRCYFAQARRHHQVRSSPDRFRRAIAAECATEERALARASVALFASRGQSYPAHLSRPGTDAHRDEMVAVYARNLQLIP